MKKKFLPMFFISTIVSAALRGVTGNIDIIHTYIHTYIRVFLGFPRADQ